jgi:phenylacetate-CoA ligase
MKMIRVFPFFIQNLLISLYNTYLYKVRHGGKYKEFFYYHSEKLNPKTLNSNDAELKLNNFLTFSTQNSNWYSAYSNFVSLEDFPILTKSDLVENLPEIQTLKENKGIVSLTGGTTGASMKVIYTKSDMQERFAILDAYREQFGYKLKKRTAWFSGKNLATEKDIIKGRCYRDDWINRIRFFSTFHICEKNFEIYWDAFNKLDPEFIVGFPSSVYELCSVALSKGYVYKGNVECFFPTAETVLPHHREVISKVLGCNIKDQYASSEGAPFILECEYGNKHLYPLSGYFEVVDDDMNPSNEGEMLVTSFTTHGTPLIRYRIGDKIKLADNLKKCNCLSPYPIVDNIQGRNLDFLYTCDRVKVNLGNISNSTKDISGIICFQVIQSSLEEIDVKVVSSELFDSKQQLKFTGALQERLGSAMAINIIIVDSIPKEKSGKFRIVKNNLPPDTVAI